MTHVYEAKEYIDVRMTDSPVTTSKTLNVPVSAICIQSAMSPEALENARTSIEIGLLSPVQRNTGKIIATVPGVTGRFQYGTTLNEGCCRDVVSNLFRGVEKAILNVQFQTKL